MSQEIDINLLGTAELTLACIPSLLKSSDSPCGSRILNITSIGGELFLRRLPTDLQWCFHLCCNEDSVIALMKSYKHHSLSMHSYLDWGAKWDGYCCSKAGLNILTRIWAEKYRSSRIHVIAIDPGKCATSSIGPTHGDPPEIGASRIFEMMRLEPPSIFKTWGELSGRLWWKDHLEKWFEPQTNSDSRFLQRPLWISVCGVGGCGKTTFLNRVRQDSILSKKLIISELSIIDYILW